MGAREFAIKRLSLPETLAESMRERILNGEFHEGDQLRQEAIANEYSVSRMPVREAFRQLEAFGLIEMQTHRGAVVKALPLDEIAEVFDLRVLLECDALRRAVPLMRDADLDAAAGLLAQLEDAYGERDLARWGALNSAYHESLYEPSGRVQSLAMIRALNTQTDRFIRMQLLFTEATAKAEADHREMLGLCRARDTDAVVEFLEGHIRRACTDLVDAVRRHRGC